MLQIQTQNNEIATLRDICFSKEKNEVTAIAESSDFNEEIKIHRRYNEKTKSQYSIYFFLRKNTLDSQIFDFQDKLTDDRIGLISPISALCSDEHGRYKDDYFSLLASATLPILIEDKENRSIVAKMTENMEFEISDFYDENLSILIINKDFHPDFNINHYLPGLLTYGYTSYKSGATANSQWRFTPPPAGKSLKILPINSAHLGHGYIESLYSDILPYESNPLSCFLLQYQVFEMLMHGIFESRINSLKNDLISFSGTASDLKELIDPFQKNNSERERIKNSIEKSTLKKDETQEAIDACKKLLSAASIKSKKEGFADLIYDVRNLIFHNYRAIPTTALSEIETINRELIFILPRILV